MFTMKMVAKPLFFCWYVFHSARLRQMTIRLLSPLNFGLPTRFLPTTPNMPK